MVELDITRCLELDYIRATRCWRSNNLRTCLCICDDISKRLSALKLCVESDKSQSIARLHQLVWLLKIRSLSDDYYVNEALLFNEDDVELDDQVRVLTSSQVGRTQTSVAETRIPTRENRAGMSRQVSFGTADMRPRTGILTGRMPSAISSRHSSSRAKSSYRPLTTSLTATQTAFSRSIRPLLKYSTSKHLAKPFFQYLYNSQTVTSRCPDYRQCLEYLNLVQNSFNKITKTQVLQKQQLASQLSSESSQLVSFNSIDETPIDAFWLMSYGICYFNLRMVKQAEEYFQKALKLDPKSIDLWAWLIKVHLGVGHRLDVLRTCENGLKHNKSPFIYNWKARVQSLMGDLYEANATMKESLQYCPTNIEALANVAHFAFYEDKSELALKCFERISQLSSNYSSNVKQENSDIASSSQLLNNLALCYFHTGFYHKVIPMFFKALLSSPSKEVTSDIWYNLSTIPLACGFKKLAIACLKLALKNNSQNEEALNNYGVLKHNELVDENIHHPNRHEYSFFSTNRQNNSEVDNLNDLESFNAKLDDAEVCFKASVAHEQDLNETSEYAQPEMLYNLALIKAKKGHLLDAANLASHYLDRQPDNYHMIQLLESIGALVMYDS